MFIEPVYTDVRCINGDKLMWNGLYNSTTSSIRATEESELQKIGPGLVNLFKKNT